MLLIDNSGSMDNIIWADGYDPKVTYTRWDERIKRGGSYGDEGSDWDHTSGNVYLSELSQDNCRDGYVEAVRADNVKTRKCLALPDPVGSGNTRYTGNYLNYLFSTFASGSDLRNGAIPNEVRMTVAKRVAKDVIGKVEGVRFGVARLNRDVIQQRCGNNWFWNGWEYVWTYGCWNQYKDDGGRIISACGASTGNTLSEIDKISSSTNTPISEALYEVTRYFRGLDPVWSSQIEHTSPITYRCQKNFTIVISDGEPTKDRFSKWDEDGESINSVVAGDTITGKSNRLPNWTDGDDGFYLDDIAQFGRDLDMRKGGSDKAGKSFDDSEFPKQNMDTYTVGFALDHPLLKRTAEAGNGQYYTANNADQLAAALEAALSDISDKVATASTAAVSHGVLSAQSLSIIPQYNSQYWTGDLKAYRFDSDPTSLTYLQLKTAWKSASALISLSSRHVITHKGGSGAPFRWGQLSVDQQNLLGSSALVEFIRGDRSLEGKGLRKREGLLGDIIASSPQYVEAPGLRYDDEDYRTFQKTYKDRKHVIYVGANDGMLHAFEAETGKELFGFVPNAVMKNLKALADENYDHRFYVDGTPTVLDARLNGQWRTVLVGGLNRGGQSIYALDVTDPDRFSESNAGSMFLWEFEDADLGYSFSRPAIVQLADGAWVAVFGNGYNSTEADGQASSTGDAMLFIVDLKTGNLLYKLSTGIGVNEDPTREGRPNGLATVTPIDLDGDHKVDYVYAGDLFGNLWRFNLKDLKKASANGEVTTNANTLLFTACGGTTCSASNRQPITSAPTVGRHPLGGVLVHFGTGKYLEPVDKEAEGARLQSIYGIWDKFASNGKTVTRKGLLEQEIVPSSQVSKKSGQDYDVRVTTRNSINWSNHLGWYMDLDQPASERIVRKPILRNGKIIYTSLLPVLDGKDPCVSESQSWLMELDALSGAALSYANFDLNGDGKFDSKDWVVDGSGNPGSPGGGKEERPPSGIKFDGEKPAPSIIPVDADKEVKVLDKDTVIIENPGQGMEGRLGWRELMDEK
ncbi:PilC/PilY family type IV pilus protein [Marinobacterium maritimum]|uniref:PilC/PilY family type IV pilus protein n=1 Tax=Marinobacterium maritimum TaxID=500162 RepID=A0ABN1I6R5_9GAMM